jgi:RHS repeat-associated protein
MLKRADDPRYDGAMTKIRYTLAGTTCQPVPFHPEQHSEWVAGQPYRIAMESSDTGVIVSMFGLYCDGGEREDYNGLGGHRKLFYGRASLRAAPWPVQLPPFPNGPHCRGYQLGKITDFTTMGVIAAANPCPAGVPCRRQNFHLGGPHEIYDGRGIMTKEVVVTGDDSTLPGEIHHPDGSSEYDNRIDASGSDPLDTSRMHNGYNHWLFRKTDERNQTTVYHRDGRRRITQIDYPDGSHESFVYDGDTSNSLNQITSHTLPSGAIETFVYHPSTHLLMQASNNVEGEAAMKEYTYDSLGRVATMREGRARSMGAPFTVLMTYNGRHNVLSVEYAALNGTAPTVHYEYDKYGNCTAIIDELGHRKDFTYDSYRRCTSMVEQVNGPGPNCSNVPSRRWDWIYDRVIDGVGQYPASAHTSKEWRVQIEPAFNEFGERRMTARYHDVNNRITREETGWIQPAGPIGPNNSWYQSPTDLETHSFTYDENGQKSSFKDPRNRETTYQYDVRNRPSITTEYPIPGDSGAPRITQTFYNKTGDKTKVIFPDGESQEWPDENYTAFGQPRVFIDERHQTTNMEYWPWGPMKKLSQVTTHQTLESGMKHQVTTFILDGLGRPFQTHFPDGTIEENTYLFGQVYTWKTRRNQTKMIGYDVRGREQFHTWSDNTPGVTRVWDAANRLTSISNVFSTIDYGLDDAGQMKWEGSTVNGGNGRTQISYCRYPSGEVFRMTYPNATTQVERHYTARGQLKDVGWQAGATSYVYWPDGKVNVQVRTNNVTTSYGYDGRGMIGSVSHSKDGHDLAKREYWRDNRDRILAWKRGTDQTYNLMENGRGNRYKYDPEGQLEKAWYRAQNPETENPVDPMRGDEFHYDELGNREGWNDIASRGHTWMARRDNGLNQYTSWANNYPNPPLHWGSPILYDDNFGGSWVSPGNGVTMAEGWIVASYNALNQPVAIGCNAYGNKYMWFGFDPLGRCVKRWKGSASAGTYGYTPATFFSYDGWNMVQEGATAASADRVYVHGGRVDEIVASWVSGNWYNHQYDAQGNCILLSTADGNIEEQYDYDAFGFPYFYNVSGGTPTNVKTRFLFTGREWISDLRIYDYRNRQYQPELGRFLQPDPKQFEAGDYNLYRYCHNDPVNKADPTGLDYYRDDFIGPLQEHDYHVPSAYDTDEDGAISYPELAVGVEGGNPALQAPTIDPIDVLSGGIAGLFRTSAQSLAMSAAKNGMVDVSAHGLRHFPEAMRASVANAVVKDIARNGAPAIGKDIQRTIKVGGIQITYRARTLASGKTRVGTVGEGGWKRDIAKKK